MSTVQFTKEKEIEYRRKSAIGLLIVSAILLGSLGVPWLQMGFSWSTTSNYTEAHLRFDVNGLGWGTFSGEYSVFNSTGENWVNDTIQSSTYVPVQGVGGTIVGIIAVLNIVMAISFLSNRAKQTMPEIFTKTIKNRWSMIILIEGVTLLAIVSLFSTFYFDIPFQLHSSLSAGGFPSTLNNLLNLYANTYSLFSWTKDLAKVSNPTWNRTLHPGLGMYFTFVSSLALLYIWYLYKTAKNKWPEVWRRRCIMIPLMIAVAFMPIARKYSQTSASTVPLLFSPFLFHVGGILYLGLVVGLAFLSYRSANIEKKINELVGDLYTAEDLTEEEFNAKRTQVDQYTKKVSKYRTALVPILVGILFVVVLVMFDFSMLFQSYVGETLGAKYLIHTPTDWILLLSPMFTVVLIAVFRQ